jgi:hypothetical protein
MPDYLGGWIESPSFVDFAPCLSDFSFPFSVSQESKQQILQPLSVLRPKFRVSRFSTDGVVTLHVNIQAIAQSLRDLVSELRFCASKAHPYVGPCLHRGGVRAHAPRLRSRIFRDGRSRLPLATHW